MKIIKFSLIKLVVLLLFFQLIVLSKGNAQSDSDLSNLGFPGLIYTPSAYLSDWGTVAVGMTHYHKDAAFTFEAGDNTERSFWANIGFLPFGEVTLRLTKPYNPSIPNYGVSENYGIGDRSISFRLQVLKERENRPAILVGTQDPFSGSSFFNTNYIVVSKKQIFKKIEFNANVGYGFKIEEANGHILKGIIGGVQAKWQQIRAMLEYDATRINIGVGYQYKGWVRTNFALVNGKYLSAALAFSFSLNKT